ncbi:UNVERIFIED_CONTAM: hypothetical protein FKN15_055473 [Acipenser sinensis]
MAKLGECIGKAAKLLSHFYNLVPIGVCLILLNTNDFNLLAGHCSFITTLYTLLPRLDSSSTGDSVTDRLLSRTSSYTRRENRLASLGKAEEEGSAKDFRKMYEDALTENVKLKSKLEESKDELGKIRSQLDKVTQVLNDFKSDNQRLKDENGALIRVISKLSK